MEPVEYDHLDRVDGDHWYYRGKRRIARQWIERSTVLNPEDLLIDIGCGTGRFIREWAATRHVIGVDYSARSLLLTRQKLENPLIQGELPTLPFDRGAASVVVALDVLEHCYDDSASLSELIRIVRPDGVLCLTVPALPQLWSDWDEALHHYRRYTREGLLALVPSSGVAVLECRYINELALAPIFALRLLRQLSGAPGSRRRAEDMIPPPLVNRILEESFVRLSCFTPYQPPLGVSVLLVLRKVGD